MNRLRLGTSVPVLSCAILTLLFLSACGGTSSSVTAGATPSYAMTAATLNPSSVTAGGASSSQVTITPANGYTGNVTLSCAAVAGNSTPSCSFSSNPVPITGGAAATSTLTVSTTINTPNGS